MLNRLLTVCMKSLECNVNCSAMIPGRNGCGPSQSPRQFFNAINSVSGTKNIIIAQWS